MSNQKITFKRQQGVVTDVHKESNHKITSCPQALYNNHIDKIQKRQLCALIENLTPTVQSPQEKEFEVLSSPSLALKNTTIPLLSSAKCFAKLGMHYSPISMQIRSYPRQNYLIRIQ